MEVWGLAKILVSIQGGMSMIGNICTVLGCVSLIIGSYIIPYFLSNCPPRLLEV